MACLAISLLGSFQVLSGGQPVPGFGSDKVRALLAYLAVESEHAHRRDMLAGLLWPARAEREALNNLRYSLSNLRTVIQDRTAQPPFLLITRHTIQFNTASEYRLDVDRFRQRPNGLPEAAHPSGIWAEQAESIGSLESTAALYRGPFLEGFSLRDSPAFEEWVLYRREAFNRRMLAALGRLAALHELGGAYELAARCARRQLALEPWCEAAHRQLMQALALDGRRDAALAQYAACQRLLAAELGVKPEPETAALHRRIRAGEIKKQASRPAEVQALPAAAFVGRERELAALNHFLDRPLAGQGQVVFVTGGAGSGKTALVHEFARRAMERQHSIVAAFGACNSQAGAGDPYLPFREVLQMFGGEVEARRTSGLVTPAHARRLWALLPATVEALLDNGPDLIGRFVPAESLAWRVEAHAPRGAAWQARLAALIRRGGEVPSPSQAPPAQSQEALFEQITRVLQALARQQPLILALDDLQWADGGSAGLLFHLGRRLASSRILIVGAYRPAEVAAGHDGTGHPLSAIVHEFRRDEGEIEVDLDQAEGRPFVDAFLDARPNDLGEPFRERLYQVTGGQALFTVELVREMQARAGLVQDEAGRWVEGAALDWGHLPPRVEAVIAGQIGRLPAKWQQALAVASVEGEVFTAEVLAHVQGLDEGEVLRQLSGPLNRQYHLVNAHSLERLDGQRLSRYRFRHHLFQKYLYDRLDAVERAHLHEAVGYTLEAMYRADTAALAALAPRLAFHFEAAGLAGKAVDYLLQAGRRAFLLSAVQESLALYRRGLALLEMMPATAERDRREMALQLALGQSHGLTAGWANREMVEAVTRAYELSQRLGEPSQLLPVLLRLTGVVIGQGRYRQALDLSGQALRLAQQAPEPHHLAPAHQRLGVCHFFLGELVPAREHLEQAASLYRCLEPRQFDQLSVQGLAVGEDALMWLPHALWMLGYPDQALTRSEEAMALAQRVTRLDRRLHVLTIAVVIFHALRGEWQVVQTATGQLLDQARVEDLTVFRAYGQFYQGWVQSRQGQATPGIAKMCAGLTALRSSGTFTSLPFLMALLADAYRCAGQPQEGVPILDEALALAGQLEARSCLAEMYRLRGKLWKAGGERQKAEECFQQAIEVARQQETKSWQLRATMSLCRLWQEQGRRQEAHQILTEIYGWFGEGFDTPDLQAAKALLEEFT